MDERIWTDILPILWLGYKSFWHRVMEHQSWINARGMQKQETIKKFILHKVLIWVSVCLCVIAIQAMPFWTCCGASLRTLEWTFLLYPIVCFVLFCFVFVLFFCFFNFFNLPPHRSSGQSCNKYLVCELCPILLSIGIRRIIW